MNHIARLNTDGSVDMNFNPGTGAGDSVRALVVQPDGRILVGGFFTNFNSLAYSHLVRLNANGSLDTTFTFGSGANGDVSAISVQADTRIVVGGTFSQFNGVTRNGITRLNPDGTTDYSINFGTGADGPVAVTLVEPDGNMDLGGAFANFNGVSHPDLVQVYGGSLAGSGAIQFSSATTGQPKWAGGVNHRDPHRRYGRPQCQRIGGCIRSVYNLGHHRASRGGLLDRGHQRGFPAGRGNQDGRCASPQ